MTDNRTTELLPCPFCGSEYTQVRWLGFKDKSNGAFESGFRGECTECFALTRAFSTEAEAIAAWNARAERTCEIESSYLNDFTVKNMCWYEFEMKCGYRFTWDVMEPPKFCPNCGGELKVVDA